jgi:hypothetical protein
MVESHLDPRDMRCAMETLRPLGVIDAPPMTVSLVVSYARDLVDRGAVRTEIPPLDGGIELKPLPPSKEGGGEVKPPPLPPPVLPRHEASKGMPCGVGGVESELLERVSAFNGRIDVISEILQSPNALHITSARGATMWTALKRRGITHVLCFGHQEHPFASRGIVYRYIDLADTPTADLASVLPVCMEYIQSVWETEGTTLLLHCDAGISRSASVCVAVVMKVCEIPMDTALLFVQAKRPCVCPNSGTCD